MQALESAFPSLKSRFALYNRVWRKGKGISARGFFCRRARRCSSDLLAVLQGNLL
jgi:hypothetical protein